MGFHVKKVLSIPFTRESTFWAFVSNIMCVNGGQMLLQPWNFLCEEWTNVAAITSVGLNGVTFFVSATISNYFIFSQFPASGSVESDSHPFSDSSISLNFCKYLFSPLLQCQFCSDIQWFLNLVLQKVYTGFPGWFAEPPNNNSIWSGGKGACFYVFKYNKVAHFLKKKTVLLLPNLRLRKLGSFSFPHF